MRHLQNTVPDTVAQDLPGVAFSVQNPVVKFKASIGIDVDHTGLFQAFDKAGKQAPVKKFRRIKRVQHRHSFGHQLAFVLQLALG